MSPGNSTSNASSIASTMQQMSISFGVASAGLATAFFIPQRAHSNPGEMIHGIHVALMVLGGFTILSTIIFRKLRSGDGDEVSQHKVLHAGKGLGNRSPHQPEPAHARQCKLNS